MNHIKLIALGLSCVYVLLVGFSISVHAENLDQVDSGVSVEGWSDVGGKDLPILDFDETKLVDNLHEDIRAENFTVDKDGSTYFQLSHIGPMSRQVFANVRRIEQSDGFTRHVITNIADGHQTEYLTRTAPVVRGNKHDKSGDIDLSTTLAQMGDQNTECPWCYVLGVVITEATCAVSTSLAHYQCRLDCQLLGGVLRFSSGICGMYDSDCLCMINPDRENEEY